MSEDKIEILYEKLEQLERAKRHITHMNFILSYRKVISEADREVYEIAIGSIDKEIEGLRVEIIIEKMLTSDEELSTVLDKFGK